MIQKKLLRNKNLTLLLLDKLLAIFGILLELCRLCFRRISVDATLWRVQSHAAANSLLEYVMNTRKMFSKIVVFLFPASYIYGKSIEGCKILWGLQNPEPATKCSGVCKVMGDCSQAAECLAGFTLPSCCEVP